MTSLKKLAPKKFLCYYTLETGALVVGIFMCCIMAAGTIATIVQVAGMTNCEYCSLYPWRNAYSFSVTSIIYFIIMVLVNLWFIWGIKKKKSSIVLSWLVITAMWLAQTFCLLLVLICIYSTEACFLSWLLSLIFGLIAIGVLLYELLVVFAFWLELKGRHNIIPIAT